MQQKEYVTSNYTSTRNGIRTMQNIMITVYGNNRINNSIGTNTLFKYKNQSTLRDSIQILNAVFSSSRFYIRYDCRNSSHKKRTMTIQPQIKLCTIRVFQHNDGAGVAVTQESQKQRLLCAFPQDIKSKFRKSIMRR